MMNYGAVDIRVPDLIDGAILLGSAHLNLSSDDIAAFVAPSDSAYVIGMRPVVESAPARAGVPAWLITLRRANATTGAVECVRTVFHNCADAESLQHALALVHARARAIGYRRVWFVPRVATPTVIAALAAYGRRSGLTVYGIPSEGGMVLETGVH